MPASVTGKLAEEGKKRWEVAGPFFASTQLLGLQHEESELV
jgi:hypothetical protein